MGFDSRQQNSHPRQISKTNGWGLEGRHLIAWGLKIGSKRNGRVAIKMYRASAVISGIQTNTETWIHPMRCQLLQGEPWSSCGCMTIPHCLCGFSGISF